MGSPVCKLLNSSGDVQTSAPQGSDRNLFRPLTATATHKSGGFCPPLSG
ncbi:MAG: hypothetical protein E5X43_37405, partial [Mesorhizobium sp.]